VFKRVRWMSMGAVAGAGASMWAQRRLRRTLDEHQGVKLSVQAAAKARRWGADVRDALAEGRDAMAEREADLKAEMDGRLVPIHGGDRPVVAARSAHRGRSTHEGARAAGDGMARLRVVDARSESIERARPALPAHYTHPSHPSVPDPDHDLPAPPNHRRWPWGARRG
jgi:hypothetical protein